MANVFSFTSYPTNEEIERLASVGLSIMNLYPEEKLLNRCYFYPSDAYELIQNKLTGGNLGLRCILSPEITKVPEIYGVNLPCVDFNRDEVDLRDWQCNCKGRTRTILDYSISVKTVSYSTDAFKDLNFDGLAELRAVNVYGNDVAKLNFPYCISLEEVHVFNKKS